MKIERLVNSKLNSFADWVIRLVVINILIITCSLPIFTAYAAFSAGYNLLHDYTKSEPTLFKTYVKYFKSNFRKKVLIELVVLFVAFIGYSNIKYYSTDLEQDVSNFILVGYYVSIALIISMYAITLYSLVVMKVNAKLNLITIFKLSFLLAGKFYGRTMILIVIHTIPLLLLLTPFTALIFVFMGITIPLLLHVMITVPAVNYLESLGDK